MGMSYRRFHRVEYTCSALCAGVGERRRQYSEYTHHAPPQAHTHSRHRLGRAVRTHNGREEDTMQRRILRLLGPLQRARPRQVFRLLRQKLRLLPGAAAQRAPIYARMRRAGRRSRQHKSADWRAKRLPRQCGRSREKTYIKIALGALPSGKKCLTLQPKGKKMSTHRHCRLRVKSISSPAVISASIFGVARTAPHIHPTMHCGMAGCLFIRQYT